MLVRLCDYYLTNRVVYLSLTLSLRVSPRSLLVSIYDCAETNSGRRLAGAWSVHSSTRTLDRASLQSACLPRPVWPGFVSSDSKSSAVRCEFRPCAPDFHWPSGLARRSMLHLHLHVPSIPGQNGPASEGGSAANSPSLGPVVAGSTASALQLAHDERESREQERLLPIANISRIMKKVLPDHAKMSKEAKAALQECVSEFIGFITSEASDRLVAEKRKTITGDDSQSKGGGR